MTLLKGILGHEWDEDIDNGYRPAGLIRMSETTVHNVQYIQVWIENHFRPGFLTEGEWARPHVHTQTCMHTSPTYTHARTHTHTHTRTQTGPRVCV